MRVQRLGRFISVYALALLVPVGAWAQVTSSITGTGRDDSGGVLPGVQVEARSPALIEQA